MTKLEHSILVIAGITGDLSRRYVLPALYDLVASNVLPEQFKIVGLSRREISVDELVSTVEENLKDNGREVNADALGRLKSMLSICMMDISKNEDYKILRAHLDKIEDETGTCMHRVYYLAVPPKLYEPVVDGLGSYDLNKGCQHGNTESRLMLEKPFGYDLKSAQALVERLKKSYEEKQVYRVDHYLAKENAQNILTFRFKNPLFNRIWDRESIEYVLITASESIGIENRAVFYEQTGALRDFMQSHMLQLLSLVAMEQPADDSSDSLHAEKLKLLKDIVPISTEQVETRTARGQYKSYKEEVENAESTTETYAALRLDVNNERWKGVPFLLRTGKNMAERVTEINLKLREVGSSKREKPDILTIRIQPNEGIVLSLAAKKPGFSSELESVQMDFCYNETFDQELPNAYEYVIVDALRGDQSLFASAEEILRSWEIIENVVQTWTQDKSALEIYEDGSEGPKSAEKLATDAGASWETHQKHICPTPIQDLKKL